MRLNILQASTKARLYITLLLFGCLVSRVFYFYLSSDQILITAIPDDAFYYIQLAKHRQQTGFWTFDGVAPATGFHLLYGYLLFFIHKILPSIDWRTLFLIISLTASIFIALSAYLISKTAEIGFNDKVSLVAFAPFFSEPIFFQATAMMESWLVVLLTAYSMFLICNSRSASTLSIIGLVLIGILGSLARSDCGLLPGVFFLICGIYSYSNKNLRGIFYASSAVLFGSIIGVLALFAHNYLLSGQLIQASAQIKQYWSSVEGNSISNSLALLSGVAFPFFNKKPFIYALCALIYPISRAFICRNCKNNKSKIVFFVSLVTIAGYVFFYSYNSAGLQNWYSANLVTPLALSFSGIVFFTCKPYQKACSLLIWTIFAAFSMPAITTQAWPHQSGMMNAGLYLKNHHINATYASWNAGIISYFSDIPIINIDGLTNDEIVPYIKSNTLLSYLNKRNINFIVDYEVMLSEGYRRRGGYLELDLDECIIPISTIDDTKLGMGNSKLKLFLVKSNCTSGLS